MTVTSNPALQKALYVSSSILSLPFLPNFMFVVSIQANLMCCKEKSCLMKNCSRASMTFRTDSQEPTTLLIGISPMKCSDTTVLTLLVPISQNGQTHSNNLSAIC